MRKYFLQDNSGVSACCTDTHTALKSENILINYEASSSHKSRVRIEHDGRKYSSPSIFVIAQDSHTHSKTNKQIRNKAKCLNSNIFVSLPHLRMKSEGCCTCWPEASLSQIRGHQENLYLTVVHLPSECAEEICPRTALRYNTMSHKLILPLAVHALVAW